MHAICANNNTLGGERRLWLLAREKPACVFLTSAELSVDPAQTVSSLQSRGRKQMARERGGKQTAALNYEMSREDSLPQV